MIAELFIPSHGILNWIDNLPENFTGRRLPGGRVQTATGEFGSACLQIYKDEGFFYLYIVLNLHYPTPMQLAVPPTGLLLWSQLVGTDVANQTDHRTQLFREMNTCLYANSGQLRLLPETNGSFEFFSAWYRPDHYGDVLYSFPGLFKEDKAAPITRVYQNEVIRTSIALATLMEEVLRCPYPTAWQIPFYGFKSGEMLFRFLVDLHQSDPTPGAYTAEEAGKIHAAEQLIVDDLTAHTVIPQLARKVGMNEQRFKQVFKMIYGKGPYEYLREKRLDKAVELLDNGEMVKSAALEAGWRAADLIKAYKARYGVTPKQRRRKK